MIRKNLDLIIVGFLVLSIVLYEETLEIIEEFLHLTLELLHTVFEWVELGVDDIVEHIFHQLHLGPFFAYFFITERHGSQVVTFYILMSIIGFFLYRLSKFFPRVYAFFKQGILIAWIRRKTQFQLYWRSLTQLHKIALLITALTVAFLASFFVI